MSTYSPLFAYPFLSHLKENIYQNPGAFQFKKALAVVSVVRATSFYYIDYVVFSFSICLYSFFLSDQLSPYSSFGEHVQGCHNPS